MYRNHSSSYFPAEAPAKKMVRLNQSDEQTNHPFSNA
jgi:hypothetical protein